MANAQGMSRRELLGAAVAAAAVTSSGAVADAVRGKSNMNPPDIVFIGAGINALSAAYLLGKAGWRVLVIDRNAEPGGAVRTMALTLPGFRHDIGAMNLTVFANSRFYQDHQEALAAKGVEFVVADRTYGSFARDGRFLGMSTNHEANLQAIAAFSEADVGAWKKWHADFDRCASVLFRIFGSPSAPADPLAYVFGQGVDVPEAIRPTLWGILVDSLRRHLTTRFESETVQALVAAWGMHLDYAPDVTGGCWMPFLETNADERAGISLVKGGSGKVATALSDLVREVGGDVQTGQTVERILFEDGRAVGVALVGGQMIRSSRAVVASVTPTALLKLAHGHLSKTILRQAQAWKYGPGTMVTHLALSDLPRWQAGTAVESFYIHIAPSLDDLAAAYQEGMAGLLSANPFCVVAQPTVFDPSRAPKGKHVLWVMVRAVPAVIRGDAMGQIQGTAWTHDVKEAFADRVLERIERYAPGLRRQILAKVIHAPTDLEALNPNLVGGDLNAGSMHLAQFYGQRPFDNGSRMPMPGLYMCGASTWPGGGANTGSGVLLAQQLL